MASSCMHTETSKPSSKNYTYMVKQEKERLSVLYSDKNALTGFIISISQQCFCGA